MCIQLSDTIASNIMKLFLTMLVLRVHSFGKDFIMNWRFKNVCFKAYVVVLSFFIVQSYTLKFVKPFIAVYLVISAWLTNPTSLQGSWWPSDQKSHKKHVINIILTVAQSWPLTSQVAEKKLLKSQLAITFCNDN